MHARQVGIYTNLLQTETCKVANVYVMILKKMPKLTDKDKVISKNELSLSNKFTISESSVATMYREKPNQESSLMDLLRSWSDEKVSK